MSKQFQPSEQPASAREKKVSPAALRQSHTHADGTEHIHTNDGGAEHDHAHTHSHSPEEYQRLIHRSSIIIGHMNSIKKMLEDERDCSDILIQISAVQSSLTSLGKLILKSHIEKCLLSSTAFEENESLQKELADLNDVIDKFIR